MNKIIKALIFPKHKCKLILSRRFFSILKPPWKCMFFGTDEFSLVSLKMLFRELKKNTVISDLEVVTTVKNFSKPNPVQLFANKEKLAIHNWLDFDMTREFDIGIVVSFGNLIPENIINRYRLGMINVHASLLPRWRGAAPIIHAIANGDKETGVTIMRIRPRHFDIGEIIRQKSVKIPFDVTMPELHRELSQIGSELLLECVRDLPKCLENSLPQANEEVTYAPRITADFGVVNWFTMSAEKVFNLHRALVGMYPLLTKWNGTVVKLQDCVLLSNFSEDKNNESNIEDTVKTILAGQVVFCKKTQRLKVQCADGKWVAFKKVIVSGKKPMLPRDFYNGFMSKIHPKHCIFR